MSDTKSFKSVGSSVDDDRRMPSILITPPSPTPSAASACRRYISRTSLTLDELARSMWCFPAQPVNRPSSTRDRRRLSPRSCRSPRGPGLLPQTQSEVDMHRHMSDEIISRFLQTPFDTHSVSLMVDHVPASESTKQRQRSFSLNRVRRMIKMMGHVSWEQLGRMFLCGEADEDDGWNALLENVAPSFVPPASRRVQEECRE